MCHDVTSVLTKVERLLKHGVALDANQVPVDRRKFNGKQTAFKSDSVDAFFAHYYHHIASGTCYCLV